MTDIFDEVDEILGDVDTAVEETVTAEAESNFNETELQDIMAEIESLEKEFETDPATTGAAAVESPVKKESSNSASEPKILAFEKKTETVPVSSSKSSEISFAANGQMNLNLSFKIGEEKATLTVDPVLGLIVTMKGVEIMISEFEGCKVTMENGVNFTIPLTSKATPSKKKAA